MAREPVDPRIERNSAAPSGASDISVYGVPPIALGMPAAALILGGATAPGDAMPPTVPRPSGEPVASAMSLTPEQNGSPLANALAAPAILAEAAMAGMAGLTVRPPAAPEAARNAETDAVQSPDRPGGSGTPPGLLTPEAVVPTATVMPAREAAPDAAMPAASVSADGMAQTIEAQADAAIDRLDERVDAMDGVVAGIDERVEAIDAGLAGRVADVGATVETIGAGLVAEIPALQDRASEITGTVTANLDSRVASVADTAGDTLVTVRDALPDIDLGPVGGVDPAGGIDTLVSMVSAADIFGLPDIGGGEDALALPLGIGGGDPLSEFPPSDVLLNVADPHDGAFGLLAGLTEDPLG